METTGSPRRAGMWLWWAAALGVYLALACWQLSLPGLHYDEAREAGQNAMELLTGAPVTAFRGAALHLGGAALPLMVQDYIGALNVYLALPLLALTGIGVPNLRALGVLTGLATLILLERAVSEWLWLTRPQRPPGSRRAPLSVGGLAAMTLAAVAPSFVFWSRQGIFVTNLTQPLVLLSIAAGLRWWWTQRTAPLIVSALAAGFALYAKLLALWVIAPFALMLGAAWLLLPRSRPPLSWGRLALAAVAFLAPLTPLVLFNMQTGGTWRTLTGSLSQSYYGVNNRDVLANLGVRLPQLRQTLEGSQFWYLGGPYSTWVAPWLALLILAWGAIVAWRRILPPLALTILALLFSVFTVSDLFVTHYALLLPLALGCVGVATGAILDHFARPHPGAPRTTGVAPRTTGGKVALAALTIAVMAWAAQSLYVDGKYHQALAATGGLGDHSDASYHLAYALQMGGMGSPIALDWGMDATVRYLSKGTVTPIEIFGYETLAEPDAGFAARLAPYLDNPDAVYLLRAPDAEVFHGRREALESMAAARGLTLTREEVFAQRNGVPLYEIWRAQPQ